MGTHNMPPAAAEAGFSLLALNISLFLFYWNQMCIRDSVNTEQATLQNMNVDEIYATIQAYMGSTFLNNFNI